MRNTYLVLVIAIVMLAGCKPKAKTTFTTNTDTSKNKGINMPDIGDIKNNSTTTTSSGNWSKTYRDKFLQGCITKASEKVSASEAFSYCNCMTDKVEAKYPNEMEVDAKLTSADIESMRTGCNSSTTQSNPGDQTTNNNNTYTSNWSAADQKEFLDNCVPGASRTLGSNEAYNYCDCMMRKLMQEYPNSSTVGNVSKEHMSALAQECLRK